MNFSRDPEFMARANAFLGMLQRGPGKEFISDEKHLAFFEAAKEAAKDTVASGETAAHILYLHGRKYESDEWDLLPVMLAADPPEGKEDQAMQGLGVMFAQDKPEYMLLAIVHISETWAAIYKPEEKATNFHLPPGIKSPSQRPDRIECVTVTCTTMDQRHSQSSTEIIRDADGKFERWGRVFEKKYDPKGKTTSPMDYADRLAVNIYMGYLMARNKMTREKKEQDNATT